MEVFSTLVLALSLNSGVLLNNNMAYEGHPDMFISDTRYYNEFSLEASIEDRLVFVGFSTRTESLKASDFWGLTPRTDVYKVRAGIQIGGLEIGVEHLCQHPIASTETVSDPRYASYDNVFVNFKAQFKPWS